MGTKFAAASSTTEPDFAATCLKELPVLDGCSVDSMLSFRQIGPGNKGTKHFPRLRDESGVAFSDMLFFDDCTYGDNCATVASGCPGVVCVRTPHGLTEELFAKGLDAFARGK